MYCIRENPEMQAKDVKDPNLKGLRRVLNMRRQAKVQVQGLLISHHMRP